MVLNFDALIYWFLFKGKICRPADFSSRQVFLLDSFIFDFSWILCLERSLQNKWQAEIWNISYNSQVLKDYNHLMLNRTSNVLFGLTNKFDSNNLKKHKLMSFESIKHFRIFWRRKKRKWVQFSANNENLIVFWVVESFARWLGFQCHLTLKWHRHRNLPCCWSSPFTSIRELFKSVKRKEIS